MESLNSILGRTQRRFTQMDRSRQQHSRQQGSVRDSLSEQRVRRGQHTTQQYSQQQMPPKAQPPIAPKTHYTYQQDADVLYQDEEDYLPQMPSYTKNRNTRSYPQPIQKTRPIPDYIPEESTPHLQADVVDEYSNIWPEEDDAIGSIQHGDWEMVGQGYLPYQAEEKTIVELPGKQSYINNYNTYAQRNTRDLSDIVEQEPYTRPASRAPRNTGLPLPQEQPYKSQRVTQPLNNQFVTNHAQGQERQQYKAPVTRPKPTSRAPQPRSQQALIPSKAVTPAVTTGTTSQKTICPRCRGAGFLRVDVPFGHPSFGKAVPCACKLAEREEKRRQELLELSDLWAFREKTFESFNPNIPGGHPCLHEAFEAAYTFAHAPQGWLLLVGPNGCGKTHLAAAVANKMLNDGSVVLFAVVPDLLAHLRATFAPNSTEVYDQRFSKMKEAHLLVLDDLGAQQSSPWANEKLFQLLNYRYNANLPTVITANPQGLNTIDERLRSRLGDIGLVERVVMQGAQDFRPRNYRKH